MEYIMSGEILDKWMEYKNRFYDVGKNILNARIFDNELDRVGRGYREIPVFERDRLNRIRGGIRQTRLNQLVMANGIVMDKASMERVLNTVINLAEFFRLREAIFRLLGRVQDGGILSRRINTIINSKRKGSGVLRKEISGKESKEYLQWDYNNLQCVTALVENREVVNRENVEVHLGLWGKSWLQPEMKNFLFRYSQGRIMTNQARSRYTEEEPYCTFCKWEFNKDCVRNRVEQHSEEYSFRKLSLPHESVLHLFWECPETKKVIEILGGRVYAEIGNIKKH